MCSLQMYGLGGRESPVLGVVKAVLACGSSVHFQQVDRSEHKVPFGFPCAWFCYTIAKLRKPEATADTLRSWPSDAVKTGKQDGFVAFCLPDASVVLERRRDAPFWCCCAMRLDMPPNMLQTSRGM